MTRTNEIICNPTVQFARGASGTELPLPAEGDDMYKHFRNFHSIQ